ncbi:GntR family transcriptional regulator [Rhizobium sp. NXC24]|uniref:GntR family transcriptional regulator n=1 Tax=Rhizobium sp. NXC24 TaxID=2048897 RepID=UPI000CDF3912|nr:GntR family transcriptional regulator [Rhizobium sp. NXC24]AVA21329.1 GntR family transcriptional regulator protein [Rhizobium sp. NXC24]
MTRIALPKIEKMPADVRALGVLRSRIVDGSIPAGSRLTEVQLSEEMELSRATIRTALHQLAKEGLVTLVPYTGWTVVELTRRDVWELYTLRAAVERLAAQLAAQRADKTSMRAIEDAFKQIANSAQVGKPGAIADADFGFHKAIVLAADHARLRQQYELIEQQIRVYIRSSDALIDDASVIVAQHKPIFEAIFNRDVTAAGDLSERHNLLEGEKLTGAIAP